MKKLTVLLALSLAAACGDTPQAPTLSASDAAPRMSLWSVDQDMDGLDDGLEWDLAQTYAPVLYMPNLIEPWDTQNGDWTWPATVDWYLPRVRLRFHHDNCSDHPQLNFGEVTPTSLVSRSAQRATSWLGCSHSGTWYSSGGGAYSTDNRFYLTPYEEGRQQLTWPGVRDPSQWKAYFHAYRNLKGGVSIQYWIFYAYNDWHARLNHEGDWEHIRVSLNAAHQPDSVYYAQHNGGNKYAWHELSSFGTHPNVWVADGSHASYASESSCEGHMQEGVFSNCDTNPSQRWFTWGDPGGGETGIRGAGLVNMGELPRGGTNRRPMPGQDWVRYLGHWGEMGNGWTKGGTNGPLTPAYQDAWNADQLNPSGGTASSSECDETSGGHQVTDIRPPC